jgi:hypothetical protein
LSVRKAEPLYQKWEHRYQERIVLPELNSQKEILDKIKAERNMRLDKHDLHLHQMKYEASKKQLELVRGDARNNASINNGRVDDETAGGQGK